ncbi:glycosyltransferase involved in cell wall biosynthesis [Desulfitispora alkaliphila]|uniref:glycosyltransferase n=1 Tax=Desulfitispora alkaliphila TaxID=622674 RepID=UPI003D22D7DE
MKILMVVPVNTKRTAGNWVTANRLKLGLEAHVEKVSVIDVDKVDAEMVRGYDIIHCFHLYKSGLVIKDVIYKAKKPLAISFTGTDLSTINEQNNKIENAEALRLLNYAKGIYVFHNEGKDDLKNIGIDAGKVKVVPQAAYPFDEEKGVNFKEKWSIKPNEIVFLYAGGIREVKRPLWALDLMEAVHEQNSAVRLELVGPVLDVKLAEELKNRLKSKWWANYRGEIPHSQMPYVYGVADIIINTSASEGMPNSLLEAQVFGVPALAHDVAGNRAIVADEISGLLFKNKDHFISLAVELAANPPWLKALGQKGKSLRFAYDLDAERERYVQLYKMLIDKNC